MLLYLVDIGVLKQEQKSDNVHTRRVKREQQRPPPATRCETTIIAILAAQKLVNRS